MKPGEDYTALEIAHGPGMAAASSRLSSAVECLKTAVKMNAGQ